MATPHMAPVPPAAVRKELPPEEWKLCLEAWLALAQFNLSVAASAFQDHADTFSPFLISYYSALADTSSHDSALEALRSSSILRQRCFLLTHRTLSLNSPPKALLHWSFLSNFSRAYAHNHKLQELLHSVWRRKNTIVEASLNEFKRTPANAKDRNEQDQFADNAARLAPLLLSLPEIGEFLMTGSDFLDELIASYPKLSEKSQQSVTIFVFLGLSALLRDEKPNISLFLDHMFSLKANGDATGNASLISSLVSSTPLLSKLRHSKALYDNKRAQDLADSLSTFKKPHPARRKVGKKAKGKQQATDGFGHGFGDVHVHRMSLISQIQDLFPNLGTGFIARLLSEYNDDVEQATSHLLEDTLPTKLQGADRSETLPPTEAVVDNGPAPDLSPAPTPPPERRNVFDDDELDQLTVDTSRLHIGRRGEGLTADAILSDRTAAPNKAAILSALAAFDSDDDERDDTYDVEDVGGTVDSAVPEADQLDADLQDQNEEALFRAYKLDSKVFERDGATRRSKARLALKSETGLTDEAIEGWLIVNGRDPRKMRRLEAKYSTWSGQQQELLSTAWRESPVGSGAEDSGDASTAIGNRGGRGRGRGRPGGRGRGRGSVAGPSDDKNTQQARQRKETSKSSRANHNRRDQRARKMARGGFAG
ncbi:hypothetical protein NA57DRAFT_67397 [Rhizodiscina lignyota]|uniref:CUE domain-containing protein n=1 Tax=Rhizodiscina lignyota TaxID=1504668 RepID=A0A9P4ID36_9PEZI|nr:hypothetical protein NA57DRAFT_67397 [Rhizodiscina lignyota]